MPRVTAAATRMANLTHAESLLREDPGTMCEERVAWGVSQDPRPELSIGLLRLDGGDTTA